MKHAFDHLQFVNFSSINDIYSWDLVNSPSRCQARACVPIRKVLRKADSISAWRMHGVEHTETFTDRLPSVEMLSNVYRLDQTWRWRWVQEMFWERDGQCNLSSRVQSHLHMLIWPRDLFSKLCNNLRALANHHGKQQLQAKLLRNTGRVPAAQWTALLFVGPADKLRTYKWSIASSKVF